MNKLYGIHIRTLEGGVTRRLYDSFSHNEITADDIIQKWDIRLNDRDSTEVEVISEYSNPIITNDKKFAAIFGGEEYCDIFEII